MSGKTLNRRDFLRLAALGAGGTLLAACAPEVIKETVTVKETVIVEGEVVEREVQVEVEKVVTATPEPPEPEAPAPDEVEFEIWVQNWGPLIESMTTSADAYMAKNPRAKIEVVPVPWADLETKLIPAIAAGTESEGFFSYDRIWRAVDFDRMLLPLTPGIVTVSEAETFIYKSALDAMRGADGEVYGFAFASGLNAATVTTNLDHFEEGFDFTALEDGTWEEVVELGVEMTQRDEGGNMTRAGLKIAGPSFWFTIAAEWILGQGGSFYDDESRVWSWQTPEAEYAWQQIVDVYQVHKTSDREFETGPTDIFNSGLCSMYNIGAWHLSGVNSSTPELNAGLFVKPRLAEIPEEDVVYWNDALGLLSLSRKLADDPWKLEVGAGWLKGIYTPEALLNVQNLYSGGIPSPVLYDSPELLNTKYGPIVQRFGELIWERTKFAKNAANPRTSSEVQAEMDLAVRGEITVPELLIYLDEVVNEMEADVRPRIGD